MAQTSLELLEAAGLAFELGARSLHVPCSNAPVELLLVRPHDIPEYVQDGVVDAGITGANLIAETASEVETLLELGFGRCTLEAAVPEEIDAQARRGSRRAARCHRLSRSRPRPRSSRPGVEAELVLLSGSVEAAPRLRALGRRRRSGLDRLDRGGQRTAPDRHAARIAGGPDRQQAST